MAEELHSDSNIYKSKEFLMNLPLPNNIAEAKQALHEFILEEHKRQRTIVLVTSGGTTVPLEKNTVRFIDNFSAGTRGSASAEYFLRCDCSVIFLHRKTSLKPFARHCMCAEFLNSLHVHRQDDGKAVITVDDSNLRKLEEYQQAYAGGKLLLVDYSSLFDYLHLLHLIATELRIFKRRVLVYLAAAVSDFYLPLERLAEHKIQSKDGCITLQLEVVPKLLRALIDEWIPHAFTVSFKLETNQDLLIEKARESLNKYSQQVVVANLLQNRKSEVTVVSTDDEEVITITDDEMKSGKEIEEKIVANLIARHQRYLDASELR